MKKTFVLRQQALTSSENITMSFDSDNEIVIPMIVYDRLNTTHVSKERKSTATRILNYIEKIPTEELMDPSKGYEQKNGSLLYLLNPLSQKYSEELKKMSGINDYDREVFQLCLDLQEQGKTVCLISKNPFIRKKANMLGITAEPFKDELAPALRDQYTGKGGTIIVSQESFEKLYDNNSKNGFAVEEILEKPDSLRFVENMFFKVTTPEYEGVKHILGRYENGRIVPLKYLKEARKNGCYPKNDDQKMLLECLFAPPEVAPLVIIKGPAGAGKTYCTIAAALSKLYNNKQNSPYGTPDGLYEQIVLAAPMIDMEDVGTLPGEIEDKMGPFLQGIKDNIRNYYRNTHTDEEKNNNTAYAYVHNFVNSRFVDFVPATYMRGRSLVKTFAIIDEAQNYHPNLILDITTRAAEGSKIIFLGDPTQINNPDCTSRFNGLVYGSETMKGESVAWQVTLEHTVRSPLAEAAIRKMKK